MKEIGEALQLAVILAFVILLGWLSFSFRDDANEQHRTRVRCEQDLLAGTSRADSLRIAIDRHCEAYVR